MIKQHTNLLYSALIAGALIGSSFFSPYLILAANAQSPTDLSSMMMNGNETGMSQNMSMPQLNLGMVTMPVVCTSLEEIFRSVAGMTGLAANATTGGGGANETQAIMDMMQEMMSGGALGGMNSDMTTAEMQEIHNMTKGVDLQQLMNMQLCSLMTDDKMMDEMLMNK
jgi:hypothetical protein